MASLEEIRQTRLQKLELLKKNGIDPYPAESKRDFSLAEVVEKFEILEKEGKEISIVGRVMSLRGQGGLIFIDIYDGTAKFQALLKKPTDAEAAKAGEGINEELFTLFSDVVDIGDFVEVHGTVFVTKRGEKTLAVKEWKMLSKSLLPLPEKWHGLQDVEERFRRRYLDILMSQDVKNRFILRSKIVSEIRKILNGQEFLEVETPMLQPIAGGTNALPFHTHHNTLDIELFLRIAPELYLKRLLVAGFPKVYELSRNFRNEGIDVTHNPEFTMLEFYESYSDKNHQMKLVEMMIKEIVKNIFNSAELSYKETKLDFTKSFEVISYFDLLKAHSDIKNPETITLSEISSHAEKLGIKVEKGDSVETLMDSIYKKTARPKLIQPTFITDYPAHMVPLAKRSPQNKDLVDAFQLVIGGVEIVKGFSELNDPIDQHERFMVQEKNRKAGDAEAQAFDEDFVESLEYGMPPAGGVGIGIDRLVMLLTDTHNIKEVILFPTMRPR